MHNCHCEQSEAILNRKSPSQKAGGFFLSKIEFTLHLFEQRILNTLCPFP
jgi:hypothetical protein